MDRAVITHAIKTFRDAVDRACVQESGLATRLLTTDAQERLDALLEHACSASGVAREDYDAALRADPSLHQLQKLALDEVMLEPNDPGPYAEVSRESPSGTPENAHLDEASLGAIRTTDRSMGRS